MRTTTLGRWVALGFTLSGCGLVSEPRFVVSRDAGSMDGATTSDEGVIADGPSGPCPAGQTQCGDDCVDTLREVSHCGACDEGCAAPDGQHQSPLCIEGRCATACEPPYFDCDGLASNGCERRLDTVTDCGRCGEQCAGAIPMCNTNAMTGVSTCAPCPSGTSACGTQCVNTSNDPRNCGGCGSTCAPRAGATVTCDAGMCRYTCVQGSADCDGDRSVAQGVMSSGCEVRLGTNENCANCGVVCTSGQVCTSTAGTLVCNTNCVAPQMRCGSGCANVQTDPSNCGACGTACPGAAGATGVCVAGTCRLSCSSGLGNCDGNQANGCETSVLSNTRHCGGCGMECPSPPPHATSTCSNGMCGFTCQAGRGNCNGNPADGCETSLVENTTSCGACGRVCPAPAPGQPPLCSSGVCRSCNPGLSPCANVCVNLLSDTNNCGACGRRCAARSGDTPVCVNGDCRTCESSLTYCPRLRRCCRLSGPLGCSLVGITCFDPGPGASSP
ncbi:MAG: hypothetical protein Q8Q09_09290 [Deltaproteobacteria bacterium]|nr:hypothetical protein [Deltaproteobacteria bacterium]